jgi:hypothetical protein
MQRENSFRLRLDAVNDFLGSAGKVCVVGVYFFVWHRHALRWSWARCPDISHGQFDIDGEQDRTEAVSFGARRYWCRMVPRALCLFLLVV